MNVTTTAEGRQGFPVRVRHARDVRDTPEELGRILVSTPSGAQVPLAQLADIRIVPSPPVVASDNTLLRSVVFLNVRGRDMGSLVDEAKEVLDANLKLPPGYCLQWSGPRRGWSCWGTTGAWRCGWDAAVHTVWPWRPGQ